MPAGYWIYERATNRYRVTADGARALGLRAGTFVGEARRVALRDAWIDGQAAIMDRLALDYRTGSLPLSKWHDAMRREVKTSFIEQYLLGKGGRQNMTSRDWGILGSQLRNQYAYLDRFAGQLLNNGDISLEYIQARARMYLGSSTQAYERAATEARGMPKLPAYPGDGSQTCKANCKCHWEIEPALEADAFGRERRVGFNCYWRLEPAADHCETCLENAAKWSPLFVAAPAPAN